MSQKHYVKEVLERFGTENCKPVKTPLEPNIKIRKPEEKSTEIYPYQNLIGSLMYLSVGTRPDISSSQLHEPV